MSSPAPVSLSDEALTSIVQLTRPLEPSARKAFLESLAEELKSEPQPIGDGAVARHARALLRSGQFHREGAYIRNEQNPEVPDRYRPRQRA